MASLGLNAYRFSISWPRVQPGGRGPANQQGLDYYRALLDELAGTASRPRSRCTTGTCPRNSRTRAAGRCATRPSGSPTTPRSSPRRSATGSTRWITLNEPQVVASHGYRTGEHAPGLRDAAAAAAATHHLLLGHGLAAQALRAARPGAKVGITPRPAPGTGARRRSGRTRLEQARADHRRGAEPRSSSTRCCTAATRRTPGRTASARRADRRRRPGDDQPAPRLPRRQLLLAALPAGRDPADLRRNEEPPRLGAPGVVEYRPERLERTPMGWLVDPDGLDELLMRLSEDAPGLPLFVTENGCAAEDYVNPDGEVNDVERVRYLHGHLEAAARAIEDGATWPATSSGRCSTTSSGPGATRSGSGSSSSTSGPSAGSPNRSAAFYSEACGPTPCRRSPPPGPARSGHDHLEPPRCALGLRLHVHSFCSDDVADALAFA